MLTGPSMQGRYLHSRWVVDFAYSSEPSWPRWATLWQQHRQVMAMDLVVTLRHQGLSHIVRYCDLPLAEVTELRDYWHERGVRDIQTTGGRNEAERR
jgi:hypothetical protein